MLVLIRGAGSASTCISRTIAMASLDRLFSTMAACVTCWSLSNARQGRETPFRRTSTRPSPKSNSSTCLPGNVAVSALRSRIVSAQDVAQPRQRDLERLIQIAGTGRGNGKTVFASLDEPRHEGVRCLDRGDALPAQFRPFHAALGLAGAGAQDLDVELRQCSSELGHALIGDGVGQGHPEYGVLVGLERHRAAT